MAVNIPGNTVLGAPYWQRRLARERGVLENQLLEKQVGAFDAQEARAEAQLDIDKGNLAQRVQEGWLKMDEQQRENTRNASAAGLSVYEKDPDDHEGAQSAFRMTLPPGSISDDVFVPREVMEAFVFADADEFQQRTRPELTSRERELQRLVDNEYITPEQRDQIMLSSLQKDAESASRVRDDKIEDYTRITGDRELAIKIADEKVRVEQSDALGLIRYIDEISGKAWEIPLENVPPVTPAPEPGRTLYDLAELATGPQSAVLAAGSVLMAWAGLPVAARVVDARQTFRTSTQQFIRALSINQRFPVGEQERIIDEVNILPQILDAPDLLKLRMESLRESLTLRMNQALVDSQNTDLDAKVRSSQKANAAAIRNFLAIMGGPQASVDVPDWVDEVDRERWQHWDEATRKRYQQLMQDE